MSSAVRPASTVLHADDPPPWRPTTAFNVAVTVGLALLVLGAAAHRPAAVVLAVPLLTEVAWSLRRVVRPPVQVLARPDARRVSEDDPLTVRLHVDAAPDADLVLTVLETEPLLAASDPLRPTCSTPTTASRLVVTRAAHWGNAPAVQTYAAAWAGHGLWRSAPVIDLGEPVVVEPGPVRVLPVVPTRRTGIAGPRPSRRPGAGSEFTGVRPFVAGDRLRNVHWRVTARRGELHVTTTAADREASLLLAVDTGSELGPRGVTTLDAAVRAAAALARRHLHEGDRVGLIDLGEPLRVLRPTTGRRQVDRVVDRLVQLRRRSPADLQRLPAVVARTSPGALVVVLSPLLRPSMGAAVARLAQAGAAVTVVDTFDPATDRTALDAAVRLLLLERDATIDRLTDIGVAVRPWQ